MSNPMQPFDPYVAKPFAKSPGRAGGPSEAFQSLVQKLSARKGVKNPEGLAAAIGRKKGKI